jgi:hypothetical protein
MTFYAFMVLLVCALLAKNTAADEPVFYTQNGTDPVWENITEAEMIPIGSNSRAGITGSVLHVNHDLLNVGPYANRPIERAINIHTLGNSLIRRPDFTKWSRWYQEDGNTQIFRLFKGEYNVRNQRANSARIEAFSAHRWTKGDVWHEWTGRYTLVNPVGAIFQIKSPGPVDWPLMITAQGTNSISINRRRQDRRIVESGRQFDLRIRDNGHDYEVYVNGNLEVTGSYDRQGLHSTFRWGMYIGGKTRPDHDAMLLVTGATVTPGK